MSTGAAESRGESGSDALASAAPQMIGDLIGIGINRCGIAVNRGGVKIAENESPLPLDRGFVTFNYFNNVGTTGLVNGAGSSPNLYRGLVGFEKTFLDGQASFGMRLPFNQSDGLPGGDGFGDLSVIMKYAFYNCPDTGRVLSGGLAVAIPTGLSLGIPGGGSLNNVLLQPWGGFICPFGDFYGHGFTSVIVPTQNRDITLYTADVGVGYRLYQCGSDNFLRAVIPTIEGHANIPLGGSCRTGQVYFPDLISVTGGVHFGLGSACWFTVAGNVPLTGPRLYDFEALAQLNVRF